MSGLAEESNGGISGSRAEASSSQAPPSRYEAQKRRDWNTFGQYLDQFGKTKIHAPACPFFGLTHPPAPCACPLRQAWGSLDALIGRLRAAFEEHGGKPESNPFGARAVRLYLREVRESQAKARGIAYEKKKRKRPPASASRSTKGAAATSSGTGSGGSAASGGASSPLAGMAGSPSPLIPDTAASSMQLMME